MTDDQLREWAYRTGDADVGAAVIRLLVEVVALRKQVQRLLTKSAKRKGRSAVEFEVGPVLAIMNPTNPQPDDPVIEKFDGTYPMRSTVADFRSHEGGT